MLFQELIKIKSLLSVKFAHNGEANNNEYNRSQLITGADQRGQKSREVRRAEHIAMHLLPAVLIAQIAFHVVNVLLIISGIVFSQCSHQNHAHNADKKYDHHERVEYGEPMDL